MTEQDVQLIEEKSRRWNSHTVDCRLLGMAHNCQAPVAAREAAADIGDSGTYLRWSRVEERKTVQLMNMTDVIQDIAADSSRL